MRWRMHCALLVALSAGCASGGASAPGQSVSAPAPAAPSQPDATALAGLLPLGADFCVVARPSRVPAPHRRDYAPTSQAAELAWLPGLELSGYAEAHRRGLSGGGARRMLLQTTQRREQVTRVLREAGVELQWQGPPAVCLPDRCPFGARWIGPQLLRLDMGRWPGRLGQGVERRCASGLRDSPHMVEIAVRRTGDLVADELSSLPVSSSYAHTLVPGGVRVERVDEMASPEAAMLVASDALGLDALLLPVPNLGVDAEREVRGTRVHTRARLLWEDLAFARGDGRRQRRAEAYTEALAQVVPLQELDLGDLDAVQRQARARWQLLAASSSPDPRALAVPLRELLEAGLARHPGDVVLMRMLAAVLTRQLADRAAAGALAQRALESAPQDRFWLQVQAWSRGTAAAPPHPDTGLHGADAR